MKLNTLSLTNFKGITQFTLQVDGQNVNIFGDNATGKTTIADAFYYLLFGKDSLNRKEFEILPLDAAGQRIPEVTMAEVEGVFSIDGKEVTLKRIYSEKWTKPRGKSQKECTGHTTDYFIDGVPVKQKDYDAEIARVTDTEEAFKLLTNPRYFCDVLPWAKRREILLKVCGDLSDEEVIASDESLASLPAILGKHSLEDHRRIIKGKLTEINKELEKVPVRIDEVKLSLPEEVPDDYKEALAELQQQRKAKQEEKVRIETGGEIAALLKVQRGIEGDLMKMDNESGKGKDADARKHQQAISDLQMHCTSLKNQVKGNRDLIGRNQRTIDNIEDTLGDLRQQWAERNGADYQGEDTCPTCGQNLPADQIEAARAKWNLNKAKELEGIQAKGVAQRQKQDELKAENLKLAAENDSLQQSIEATEVTIKDEQVSASAILEEKEAPNPERQKKLDELKATIESISKLRKDNAGAQETVQVELNKLDGEIIELEKARAGITKRKDGLKRIEELKVQQKDLAKKYEELEQELYLTDCFVQAKVSLLESAINSKFSIARFKLFEKQVNGGVTECCEVTVDGIPYGAGLNNGARINAGLDIINTLSEHYGFAPVVFIDNAEAITALVPTTGQQIRLYVSETDKELRVEIAEQAVTA